MKHFSKKIIPYFILRNALICLGLFALFVVEFQLDEEVTLDETAVFTKYALIIAIVGFVVLSVYRYLYYKTSGYKLTDTQVICTIGVLFRKQSFVEYERIHAINKKQGLIQQMFNLATLTIDSGSTNTAHTAEIKIIEDVSLIDELVDKIKKYQNKEVTEEVVQEEKTVNNIYKFEKNRKLSYCLLNISTVGFSMLIVYAILFLIDGALRLTAQAFDFITFEVLSFLLLALAITVVLTFIGSVISVFIGYYDFTLKKTPDSININYGLFEKHSNTFSYKRIKSVRIHQSLIKRIFGYAELTVDVIGYGEVSSDESKEKELKGVLVPLCKLNEVNDIIKEILPNYVPDEKEHKSISYFAYTHIPFIFISIFTGITLLFTNIYLLYLKLNNYALITSVVICLVYILITLLLVIIQAFHYHNHGLTIKDHKITLYRGGLIKETVVILKENLISIERETTKHRAKKGIYTYIIHYKNNNAKNTIKVKNLSKELEQELIDLLIF